MTVGGIQPLLPVPVGDIVLTDAQMVGDSIFVVSRPALGHLGQSQRRVPVQRIHRTRMDGGQLLPARISPTIVGGAGHVDGTRRDQTDQLMLIYRARWFRLVVGSEVVAEPMREGAIDAGDGLAEAAPRQSRTPTPRIIGDDHGKPFIQRPCPQGGLAQP